MTADPIISVKGLSKSYASGQKALDHVDLDIRRGEIFALLGPNGAGKTTLISIICGIVNPTTGTVTADGHDILKDYRAARSKIGLVPQEITVDSFEKVWNTVAFSRGLFGKAPNPAFLEGILKDLSLLEKKDSKVMALSGGMKRRLMIAKALSHEPTILFLDEPTAGVDVELRRSMWEKVRELRNRGVTVILTTHYIEEAQEMADRIGIINKGKLILVDDKTALMKKLGKRQVRVTLVSPLKALPPELVDPNTTLSPDGTTVVRTFDARSSGGGISDILQDFLRHGIAIKDIQTKESSLEEIFVDLVGGKS